MARRMCLVEVEVEAEVEVGVAAMEKKPVWPMVAGWICLPPATARAMDLAKETISSFGWAGLRRQAIGRKGCVLRWAEMSLRLLEQPGWADWWRMAVRSRLPRPQWPAP